MPGLSGVIRGEALFLEILSEPLDVVIRALRRHLSYRELLDHLPDAETL